MGEQKDSFVFYRSFRDAARSLNKRDQAAVLLAICDYALDGEEPQLAGPALAVFTVAKPNIDANSTRRKNGGKGGRPKGGTNGSAKGEPVVLQDGGKEEPMVLQNDENNKPNENENGNENEKRGADKPPRPRFVPPTVEEVRAYCRQKGYHVDPEAFVNFYAANGWKQGKGKPIVDWKACVATWERREHPAEQAAPAQEAVKYGWDDER